MMRLMRFAFIRQTATAELRLTTAARARREVDDTQRRNKRFRLPSPASFPRLMDGRRGEL